jgi:hypothetical protein
MSQNRESAVVEGISDEDALIRFHKALEQEYRVNKQELTQPSMVTRISFSLNCCKDFPVTLMIWATDTILVQGSPNIPKTGFEEEVGTIIELAKSSIESTPSSTDSMDLIRARTILAYIDTLNIEVDVERMVLVSLCDIVLDLILCHQIEVLGLPSGVKDAYLPSKIASIEKKESVYREDQILRAHRLRNQIAHGGSLITQDEAKWVLELTIDVEKHA